MFPFALPAGALADIIDRRRLLIAIQVAVTVLVAAFGILVWRSWTTPDTLLVFTFLSAAAAAIIMPAWQAIVPQLVPRQHLKSAVALNSIGLNVSRAIGPALAGVIIAAWGMAAPFWINAMTTLGVIAALIWWHPPGEGTGPLRQQCPTGRRCVIFWGIRQLGGTVKAQAVTARAMRMCGCNNNCAVHGHGHARAWSSGLPISDLKSFWGALGCACWAV
jgi:MFS family permease